MFRVCRARGAVESEQFKRHLVLHHLNAQLQRAKKIPPVKTLLAERKPPSLKSIVATLQAKPTFQPRE